MDKKEKKMHQKMHNEKLKMQNKKNKMEKSLIGNREKP
jgi:hypothetical protein